MKKTLVSTIAGVALLSGCTQVVMEEANYRPLDDASQPAVAFDGNREQFSTPAPMHDDFGAEEISDIGDVKAAQPAPAAPKYAPMAADNSPRGITSPAGGVTGSTGGTVAAGETYVVKAGDTMERIARRHRVSLKSLLAANNMTMAQANRIRIGAKLVIPGTGTGSGTGAVAQPKSGSQVKDAGSVGADGMYVVKAGDNLTLIARRLGVRIADLQKANNLSEEATRRLQIGQKLIVPGRTAVKTPAERNPSPQTSATPAADVNVPVPAEKTVSDTPVVPENDGLDVLVNDVPTSDVAPAVDSGSNAGVGSGVPADFTDSIPDVVLEETITLEEYAKKNNTTPEELRKLNAGIGDTLTRDQVVFIPVK